jgi:3alpha(or 20beta)-hydroxysteroid dehydrogenase
MNVFFSLQGQVAIVTGGGSGIGLTVATRFVDAGATVVIADVSDCTEIAANLGCSSYQVDVSDRGAMHGLIDFVVSTFDRIDILVNNAGVFAGYKSTIESTEADFKRCFDVNVLGVANGIAAAAPHMVAGGRIVNMASLAGVQGCVDLASYSASKHAVVGITKTAALELGERGIRVNCLCPASVNTPMAHEPGGELLLEWEQMMSPLGRICEPDEVAAAIHFLSSNDCGFINGQALTLCGGLSVGVNDRARRKLAMSLEEVGHE